MTRTSASGLPMIKCSSCGIDIDILQLADHVCAPAASSTTAAPAVTPPESPKVNRAGSLGSFSKRSEGQPPMGRMRPPPRIDSNAANKPFRPLEPSPMSNYSDPRSRSPMLSPTPPKSPYKMNRSATAPVPRPKMGPPSPKISSNLDCAFPPFPSKRSATFQTARPQQRERREPSPQHLYAEPSPLFAPLSPRFDGGDNIAKRMDSIAPGPFDGRADRRPSTSSSSKPPSPLPEAASFGHRRTGTQGSARSVGSTSRQRSSVSSTMSRASAYSNRSVGLPAHPKMSNNINSMPPPPLPASTESNEGIDAFLDRLQKESMGPAHARKTSDPKTDLKRDGSKERKQPPPRPKRPSESHLPISDMSELQPSAFVPTPINAFPPRNASIRTLGNANQQNAVPSRTAQLPPLLPPGFSHDTPMNPLHTPSDSGLSDDSYASSGFRSAASSRSSPPASEASHSRQASKLGRSEYLGDSFERTASPDSYAGSPKYSTVKAPLRSAPSQPRFNAPEPIPPPSPSPYADLPESPMDPAIQLGIAFDRRPKQSASRQDSAQKVGHSPLGKSPDIAPRRQESRPASKGKCRGCSEPIVGKSVKDSSGRLTGRYHKHCFVCKTCSDPFPTAEFYVYENSPYCERHYHELNGSVCASCNRGIEGQYLETDARTKFHPKCFNCSTCRVVLRDDYYEVNGQRYCDRHAHSAANPPQSFLGPGGFRPRLEKRSTRLMMMA
ncbi:hypothetical protein HBI25_122780 [Parastagonospora nodorum]|nr:hypothetical protein HBH52_099090 [Parastagonospora nodorum]KAH4172529.1 hypothetical protein HBH43_091140 [Parastagonospora nodorum]KAH4852118.1 hypothetical protein HBH75_119050 [Parastagonospora nodorum]KAH4989651.1 hypothetical protein HBI76_074810 [Parastagonospora nodorum]KAH5490863.1 hypothetical protein HBI31_127360 [Parastagonospora nodorum]